MAEEMAKQEQRRAAMDKEHAQAELLDAKEQTAAAEHDSQRLKERLEKKELAQQRAAAATAASNAGNKAKTRAEKKPGCAPDDPLCGIPLN